MSNKSGQTIYEETTKLSLQGINKQNDCCKIYVKTIKLLLLLQFDEIPGYHINRMRSYIFVVDLRNGYEIFF